MKKFIAIPLLILILFGCEQTVENASVTSSVIDSLKTENPLIGTWKVISTQNLITSEYENESENYYHIFSTDYHMIMKTPTNRPKVFKGWSEMNQEELTSQFPMEGGLLKYEIRGNAMYSYYVSALNASLEGSRVIDEYELKGDTLVHRNDHYPDGQMREWKLIRMEQ